MNEQMIVKPTKDELNDKVKQVIADALRRSQYFWEENQKYYENVFNTKDRIKWLKVVRRFVANPKMKFVVED